MANGMYKSLPLDTPLGAKVRFVLSPGYTRPGYIGEIATLEKISQWSVIVKISNGYSLNFDNAGFEIVEEDTFY